jgi:hypothetical protein
MFLLLPLMGITTSARVHPSVTKKASVASRASHRSCPLVFLSSSLLPLKIHFYLQNHYYMTIGMHCPTDIFLEDWSWLFGYYKANNMLFKILAITLLMSGRNYARVLEG